MARAKKPKKLGKRMQAILDRLSSGERLCKSLRLKEDSETEVLFHFEPSGRGCPYKTALKAIAEGRVVPLGDALFSDDMSQTWGLPV